MQSTILSCIYRDTDPKQSHQELVSPKGRSVPNGLSICESFNKTVHSTRTWRLRNVSVSRFTTASASSTYSWSDLSPQLGPSLWMLSSRIFFDEEGSEDRTNSSTNGRIVRVILDIILKWAGETVVRESFTQLNQCHNESGPWHVICDLSQGCQLFFSRLVAFERYNIAREPLTRLVFLHDVGRLGVYGFNPSAWKSTTSNVGYRPFVELWCIWMRPCGS